LASILFAAGAFSIQRDRRAEQSSERQFEDELSEVYDAIEKDPAAAKYYDQNWRDIHVERHRAALSSANAHRWESACRFWMLAAGCALAAVVMLYVSGGRA
jgi:hypothetical protein